MKVCFFIKSRSTLLNLNLLFQGLSDFFWTDFMFILYINYNQITMNLTKKKLTLSKKTLFLYQKPLIGRPTFPTVDPTISSGGGPNFPATSFKPENI